MSDYEKRKVALGQTFAEGRSLVYHTSASTRDLALRKKADAIINCNAGADRARSYAYAFGYNTRCSKKIERFAGTDGVFRANSRGPRSL